jgi:hypothetical protein
MVTESHSPKSGLHRLGSELLAGGLTLRITASGHSMFPAIRQGDVIEIVPVGTVGLPVVGEVVALKRENDFVVHRLLGYYERDGRRWLFTRGDSVLRADDPYPEEALAGRVVTIIRGKRVWRNPAPRTNINYRLNRLLVVFLQLFLT